MQARCYRESPLCFQGSVVGGAVESVGYTPLQITNASCKCAPECSPSVWLRCFKKEPSQVRAAGAGTDAADMGDHERCRTRLVAGLVFGSLFFLFFIHCVSG
jgi:hypothetical protein